MAERGAALLNGHFVSLPDTLKIGYPKSCTELEILFPRLPAEMYFVGQPRLGGVAIWTCGEMLVRCPAVKEWQ